MGTGFYRYSLNWWGEFDGNHWYERASVPGKTRTLAASAATNKYVYVSGGVHYGGVNTTGEVLKDIRRYDPQQDGWTYIAILKEGLINHVSFAIGKRVYIGLGENQDEQINDKLYYFEE
jgi:N-acetylneuraminic acid mutarotase